MVRCSHNHEFLMDPDSQCEVKRSGCSNDVSCGNCKYMNIVLGDMTDNGNNIFFGEGVEDLHHAALETLKRTHEGRAGGRFKTGRRGVLGAQVMVVEADDDDEED